MKKIMALLIGVLAFSLIGCGEAKNEVDADKVAFAGEYIVDAEYVKENLDNIIIVDARGEKDANKGTVKGAITTTWQYLATCEDGQAGDPNWGCILDVTRLSERLGALGLAKDKEIILFSDAEEGWGEDGRIAWELIAAGYENVKIVNGGINALKAAGVEMQKGASTLEAVAVTIDVIDETHVINTEELKSIYDTCKVVDVREDKEYEGKKLYGEANGGHLPGAIHIKYTDLFDGDSTLKSKEEITKMFEEAGLSKDDHIVTYCTGGIRSAYMQLVMEMCGFENSENYDESFYRWCVNEALE